MNLNDLRIAFDVDGTLIHDGNPAFKNSMGDPLDDVPRYTVIELFRALEELGANLYIWSGNGTEYAAEWRDKLGLSAVIAEKGSFKPEITIDDEDVDFGKVNLKVLGNNDDIKVCFDVNGTLIYEGDPDYTDDNGDPLDGTPRYTIIKLFEAFKNLGVNLYIWSSEGEEFAQSWKDRLGLTDAEVVEKSKDFGADIAVDNKDFDLAKVTIPV